MDRTRAIVGNVLIYWDIVVLVREILGILRRWREVERGFEGVRVGDEFGCGNRGHGG